MTKRGDIPFDDRLYERLQEMAEEFGYHDGRGPGVTRLVKEAMRGSVDGWSASPYVCVSSDHVIFVDGGGDVYYRCLQELQLNSFRSKMPCAIELKPEKVDYYRRKAPGGDLESWLRSRWMFNYFKVSMELPNGMTKFSDYVDPSGTQAKVADLEVRERAGRTVLREMLVALEDYVQWAGFGEGDYDRVDIPIEIPTRNLRVTVVVDETLWPEPGVVPPLAVELRNREHARFPGTEVLLTDPGFSEHPGSHEQSVDTGVRQKVDLDVQARFRSMTLAIKAVLASGALGKKSCRAVEDDATRERLENLKLPTRYRFYDLEWRLPLLGLMVCVGWEKPARRMESEA